jgi:hypothetical protein
MIAMLLTGILTVAFDVQPVETELSRLTVPKESAALRGTMNVASQEPPPTEWNRTYGGTGNDYAYALVQTSDGGYALAGTGFVGGDHHAWLVKTNSAGNALWNRTYGGTGGECPYALVQTNDGGYALAGIIQSGGAIYDDFWLVKTDASGNMQWNMTYGGTNYESAYALVQTADGGYALAGWTRSFGAGGDDFWLVRTDASGNMLWNKTYGGTNNDELRDLVQTVDGGYALAGNTVSFGAGDCDFWLVKTDASGNMLWNKTYGGTGYDWADALVQTSDGGYALAGNTVSFGAGYNDFWLVKTNSAGNALWNRTYGGTNFDLADALVQTSDGGYALAGWTTSFGAGSADFWLVKTDAAGNEQWNRTYGGTGGERPYALVQTNDGGYALAGWTTSFGAGNVDFWLVKVGSNDFAARIVGYTLSLDSDYVVHAALNVTMLSQFLSSAEITCCLVLVDTSGNEVYDNFAGIGGPQDDKSTFIENNTVTSVEFTLQLQEPRPGKYAYSISIWRFDEGEIYDSTDWIPAFDVKSWPIYVYDLGTLLANSYIQDNPLVFLRRFDSINYTFGLAESVTDLSVKVFTLPDSEFKCALNASNAQMDLHGEILPHFNVWQNVPENTYMMNLEMESSGTHLVRIVIQAGSRIESPSVKIIGVEPTSIFATPSGTMNYKIGVGFNVTTYDDLLLTATFDGQVFNHTYTIEPFKSNVISDYLQVDAPSEIGQYTVDFNTSLLNLGIFDNATAPLNVDSNTYNIIVEPTVQYYQECFQFSSWKGTRVNVDDTTKLKALDVTNIRISSIDSRDPQTLKPSMVGISFDAANKEKDVQYAVYVKISSDKYQLGVVISKDDPSPMVAHNIPVVNDKVSFTILYNKWTFGNWAAEVGTKAVKAIIGPILSIVAPTYSAAWFAIGDQVTQLAKYTMLYTAQMWMEQENAYMTIDDAIRIIESSGIEQSVFVAFLRAAVGVTHNPFDSFIAAVEFLHDSGKMSYWNYARAYVAALGYIFGKTEPRFLDIISGAFEMAAAKLGILLVTGIVRQEMGNAIKDPGKFLRNLGGIIDGAKAILAAAKILVSPSEEGKEVGDAQIGTDPAKEVDPVISMSFEGQVDYTNDTCFGDMLSMNVSFDQTRAHAIFEVDNNLTAMYLALFSDSASRSGILSSFGFNATQTSIEWRSENNSFVLEAIGSPYEGLIGLGFWMNSSYVQGTQTMSTEASQTGYIAWLNGTLSYPFGRILNNCISVFLPPDSLILRVLPSDNCTIEGSTVTWNCTVDAISIEFIPPSTTSGGGGGRMPYMN